MKKTFTHFTILFLLLHLSNKAQTYIPQAVQLAHNSADNAVSNIKIWVNDTVWVNALGFQQATPKLSFAVGTHTLGISYLTATVQAQSIIQHTFDFGSSIDDHFLTLNGILGDPQYPLTIEDYTSGPVGLPAPNSAYFALFNGCVNCGTIQVNASCSTAAVTTLSPINNMLYSGTGGIGVQSSIFTNTDHTLTLAITSATTNYGSFVLPLQNSFQKFNNIIMNGSFNQVTKTAGVGFGLAVVPVTGGSVTTLTKVDITTSLKEEDNQTISARISPNPSASQLNVAINSSKNDVINLQIVDMLGKNLMKFSEIKTAELRQVTLNIALLDAGVYFLKIQQGINEKSIKFIKE